MMGPVDIVISRAPGKYLLGARHKSKSLLDMPFNSNKHASSISSWAVFRPSSGGNPLQTANTRRTEGKGMLARRLPVSYL